MHFASSRIGICFCLCLLPLLVLAASKKDEHKYETNEQVPLFVNKVGPFFNPHETYHYYQLPVCRPDKIEHKSLTLGEVLDGDRMAKSLYTIKFRQDVQKTKLCDISIKPDQIKELHDAIEDLYYFEFVLDDIPIRGFVGNLEEGGFIPHKHSVYLWTHHDFTIEYNDDQIIYASVATKQSVPLDISNSEYTPISFTYSVRWVSTQLPFAQRASRIREDNFFPKTLEIHWLSIINSLILNCLLVGFVAVIITRILRKDFDRYSSEEEDADDDDNGWKIIHADVFRPPVQCNLFCAIIGVGSQLIAIASGILLMALLDFFNVHRHGAINAAAISLYGLTCGVAGYVSSMMYKKLGGQAWVKNVNLVSCLFSVPFFTVWSLSNSVSWLYGTTQALPWTTIMFLIIMWLLLGYPLTVIGGIIGKNTGGSLDAPCRTKNIPREIPSVIWYKNGLIQCLIGGFLPFSAISVELYYIFATVWGRQHYTLYGILFIIYFILISVTACVSIALTYFQLASEDYRWWWRSVLSAGSTGLFIFFYSIFYFFVRSNMSGVIQFVEFFEYSILTCYMFFLALGTISFFASLKFVRYIYTNVKID